MSRIVGLDLSLTRTGWAVIDAFGVSCGSHPTKPALGHPRIEAVRQLVRSLLPADLVVIEGLAYAAHDTSRGNAGLSWIVRHDLWRRDIPYALVPPATLKKYATGNGGAAKVDMLDAARLVWPDVKIDWDDEADALWLAEAGRGWLDGDSHPALDAVAWPDLGVRA